MDMDLKQTLRGRLESIAPEYGLVELSYPSFVRYFGFRSQPLSAADVVDGISALLEAATGLRLEVDVEGSRGGGEWFGGSKSWHLGKYTAESDTGVHSITIDDATTTTSEPNEDEAAIERPATEAKWWIRNFWVAYDALGSKYANLVLFLQ